MNLLRLLVWAALCGRGAGDTCRRGHRRAGHPRLAAINHYIRAYSFLAHVMPWTDRDLESLYLYGRALLPLPPKSPDDPLPQISDAVLLSHLRTEARGQEENLSLATVSTEPGTALPGGGTGKGYESRLEKLSQLSALRVDGTRVAVVVCAIDEAKPAADSSRR